MTVEEYRTPRLVPAQLLGIPLATPSILFCSMPHQGCKLQTYRASFCLFLCDNLVLLVLIWSGELTIQVSGINSYNRQTVSSFSAEWYFNLTIPPLQDRLSTRPEIHFFYSLRNFFQHRLLSGQWWLSCLKEVDWVQANEFNPS